MCSLIVVKMVKNKYNNTISYKQVQTALLFKMLANIYNVNVTISHIQNVIISANAIKHNTTNNRILHRFILHGK